MTRKNKEQGLIFGSNLTPMIVSVWKCIRAALLVREEQKGLPFMLEISFLSAIGLLSSPSQIYYWWMVFRDIAGFVYAFWQLENVSTYMASHTIKISISFIVSLFRCLQLQQDQVTFVWGVVTQVMVKSKMIAGTERLFYQLSVFFKYLL